MQAVISLCHFCETHGPRVLMTCQPMRSIPSDSRDTSSPGIENMQIQDLSDSPEQPPFYGECWRTVFDTDDRCLACTSFGNGPCLLSNDHANKTSYVSSQVALSEPVFEKVKYACLRSLSCEVTFSTQIPASPEKPPNGLISRGYTSKPSTSKTQEEIDEELRIACESGGHVTWSDVEHGATLALTFRLQDSKARGFLRLFSFILVANDVTFLLNNHDFFLAAMNTMKDKLQSLSSIVFADEMAEENLTLRPENACRIAKLPMGLFRDNRRRIDLDTQRTLQAITGDDDVWNKLHRQMMWTLRTQTLRMGEAILEGVPTQDMLVIMELDDSEIVELDLDSPNSEALTLLQLENLKIIAKTMVNRGCEDDLDLLIKQIIRGGQIVVESASRPLAKQFLLAICNLLPIGCIKILNWSDHYQHSYLYNLLGCPLGVDIPLDADVLLVRLNANGQEGPSLEDCTFEIKRRPQLAPGRPTLVGRFKQLLLDSEVQDSVLEATIKTAREQWMAKSKLIFQLTKQSAKLDLQKAIRVVKATEADREVLLFWQAGLSKAYKAHVIKTINSHSSEKQ